VRAIASAVLVLLLAPAASLADVCPTNFFSEGGNGFFDEHSSTAPSDSWGGLSYNHVAGTLTGGITGAGELGAFSQLTAQDRYVIVGPTSATPIALQVRLHFTGSVGADQVNLPPNGPQCVGSSLILRLTHGALQDEELVGPSGCVTTPFDRTLELSLEKVPGEEFLVSSYLNLSAGQSIQATASGVLTFHGLPAGYTIQSCQGYAGTPVATKTRSWGAVKQLYR